MDDVSKMVQAAGPRPIVFCGPSGSGKSTLLERLLKEFPDTFAYSVSHTTRKPRDGEKHGVHYHYTSRDEMLAAIARGEFVETAEFGGNIYGTSHKAVDVVRHTGKVCVIDLEIEGVKQIKNTDLNPIMIFVQPPSLEHLEQRLRDRGTESEESLNIRLNTARVELEFGKNSGVFDFVVHNDNLEEAYKNLKDYVIKELEKQKDLGFNTIQH